MEVRIKRLSEKAVIPSKAHASDAGFDLVATGREDFPTFIEYGTSLAFSIPEGHVGLLFPRSSISKTDLTLANSVGVIDAGYLGEVKLRFKRPRQSAGPKYNVGDRIGQLIIMPIPTVNFLEVDELGSSERGDGGWGSTGE